MNEATTATARSGPGGRNVGAEVRTLVTNVVNLANHVGDTTSAAALTAEATEADTTATIVVAGEAKQGKSSLINGLLAREGLSPVDADIATAVPLRFSYAAALGASLSLSTGRTLEVAPDELRHWVSVTEAPIENLRQVKAVDVRVPSGLLEPGIVLVDTPGVGGLVAGHAQMTLRSLEHATAMVFVTDADTKLTRPELEFLARAGERIAAVVFVVTKIDATPDWRLVMEEDREVLARWAPRFASAPMLGVSARLAARSRTAAANGDRPLAADLWVESGLGQVQGLIAKRLRPVATTLAVANTVASSRSTLARLDAVAQRRLLTDRADPDVAAAFEAEKERVVKIRADQQSWGMVLERSIFEARMALRDQVKASSEALRTAGEELIKTTKGGQGKLIAARIDADLDAQAQELSAAIDERSAAVCVALLERVDVGSPLELSVNASGSVNVKPFDPGATRAMNVLSGSMAGATGWSLVSRVAGKAGASSALLAGVVGPTLASMALPLLGALVGGYAIHHIRSTTSGRAELAQWARAEVDRATNDRYADIERVLTSAKFDIAEVVRAGLSEREREVSTALEEARAARARSEKERVEHERNDRKVVNTLVKLSQTAEELLATLLDAALLTAPNSAGFGLARTVPTGAVG